MHIPDFLKFLVNFVPPPPPFRFNRQLYAELVRELGDGSRIAAPDAEPDVAFEMGPIDGHLGSFNPSTLKITVDVLEIFFLAATGAPVTVKDLVRKFDEDLTSVLAHEGGHWHLHKRVGWRAYWDKFAMLGLFLLIGVAALLTLVNLFWNFVWHRLVPWAFGSGSLEGWLMSAAVVLFAAFIYLNFFRAFVGIWRGLSFALTYQVCWTERFARQYAEDSKKDPRWDGVIETPDVVGN